MSAAKSFRERLAAHEWLIGTFLKTPAPHATEILGDVGYDFVVVDGEHAPFDRTSTDVVLLAARAAGIAALVRVPDSTPAHLLAALDDGADGVLVPHISSAAAARAIVSAARYRGGKRGFSNSPRAGRYGGLQINEHVAAADARVTVLAMIEDPEVLGEIDALAAVSGLDGLFLGRGDLTVALSEPSPDAPVVRSAVERIAQAGRARGIPLCAHVARYVPAEVDWLRSIGVTVFVVSSDQGLLRRAATETLQAFRAVRP
jgi:2-keto-3-deoxy-L-rhamnonate aldolase RhmA